MMFLYLLQHVIVVVIAILSAIAIVLVIRVARLILVSIVLVAVAAAVVVVADRGSEDQKADYKNLQGPRPLRGRHPQPRLPVFQGPLWARPRLSLDETFQW